MRALNISNQSKRDAMIGIESLAAKRHVRFVLPDGSDKRSIKVLRSTMDNDLSVLLEKAGSADALSELLLKEDPEVDMERTGMLISDTHRVYVDEANKVVYQVALEEIVMNTDGSVKEKKPCVATEPNVATELPLNWTGKFILKDQALRSFVFTRKYQLKHVNGLTYDFLYDMAKNLQEQNSMVLIGGGKKGNEPLVFQSGGTPYRGFLEGRIKDDKYLLILHLSNLEIKEFAV